MSQELTQRDQLVHPAWLILPSWLLSVMFHVSLAISIIVLSNFSPSQSDISGDEGEAFQEVGIHLRPSTPTENITEESESEAPPPVSLNPLQAPELQMVDAPPVEISLPQMDLPPLIGAGRVPAASDANLDSLIKPSLPPSDITGIGPSVPIAGGTSFLGINDVGKKFVYVIDRSFSMENDNALQAAKSELLASLQRLDSTQQFQIIFYHDDFIRLETREGDYFWGTDAQRLLVSNQIGPVYPKGGTRHLPALYEALSLKPDVIFLLTDGAAETALTRRDFDALKKLNQGHARIHCIEFGRALKPLQGEANFLIQLAQENGGKYMYRNVRRER